MARHENGDETPDATKEGMAFNPERLSPDAEGSVALEKPITSHLCVGRLRRRRRGWIRINWQASECGMRYGAEQSLIGVNRVSEVKIR
jgi:hypothetical protein